MSEPLVVREDLKSQMKSAEFTYRDVAVNFGIRPSTLSNYLNGYAPMPLGMFTKIQDLAKRRIAANEARRREAAKRAKREPLPPDLRYTKALLSSDEK